MNGTFNLPFTVLSEEALGLNIFMRDYFDAHADESASDFYTNQVAFARFMEESGDRETGVVRRQYDGLVGAVRFGREPSHPVRDIPGWRRGGGTLPDQA